MTVRVDPRPLSSAIGPDVDAALIAALRDMLSGEVVASWFGRLQVEHLDGPRAVVSQPTNFLRSWTLGHYADTLLAAVRMLAPEVEKVDVVLRSTAARSVGEAPPPKPSLKLVPTAPKVVSVATRLPLPGVPKAILDFASSPLDRRLTFDSFQVGRSNMFAHAAACRAAGAIVGETPTDNPLFLHGAVGLGKTHLLQAIVQAAAKQRRRVLYLTAERFMHDFVVALKAQTSTAFREGLREVDLLVLDDAQFFSGKIIGTEVGHIVDTMLGLGRHLVVAADRPPADLEGLDERVRSRLSGGLTVEVNPLDYDIRLRLLEARVAALRAQEKSFDVPAEVLAYVASAVQGNGRDLAGAANRLLAHTLSTGEALTETTAQTAIRDLVRTREPKRVKIEDIQKLVATHYNVSRADILSSRRTANVVRPRQVAMYLAKVLTLRSLPEIGRRFSGRDHTTVLHAVRKIEGLASCDPDVGRDVKILRALLEEA